MQHVRNLACIRWVAFIAAAVPVVGVLTLSGCGSTTRIPELRATPPTIYLQSLRAPARVSRCLERQLSDVQTVPVTDGDDHVELLIDRGAWLIDVRPVDGGARVAARRGNDGERIEPDVRFAIARCTL